jgi:hypothetical protein
MSQKGEVQWGKAQPSHSQVVPNNHRPEILEVVELARGASMSALNFYKGIEWREMANQIVITFSM